MGESECSRAGQEKSVSNLCAAEAVHRGRTMPRQTEGRPEGSSPCRRTTSVSDVPPPFDRGSWLGVPGASHGSAHLCLCILFHMSRRSVCGDPCVWQSVSAEERRHEGRSLSSPVHGHDIQSVSGKEHRLEEQLLSVPEDGLGIQSVSGKKHRLEGQSLSVQEHMRSTCGEEPYRGRPLTTC